MGRTALAVAAVAILCAGLLPQAAFGASQIAQDPAESVETEPTPGPTEESVGDELAEENPPADEDAVDAPAEDAPQAPADDDTTGAHDPAVPEDGTSTDSTGNDIPTPSDDDYAGDTTTDEADPGGGSSLLRDGGNAYSLAGFRPGNIISDAVFYDGDAMSMDQIASFLSGKVSSCRSGYTCLPDYRQTTKSRSADQYCDGYSGGGVEGPAKIIYKTARSCGINPKALIVMLQKEQGLVTHTWPSASRYEIAMGMACPDNAPCDEAYYGFQNQVYSAARQLIVYGQSSFFNWYPVGQTSQVLYHPNTSCGSGPVHIENKATAALYYYTPYQPNRAALDAGYGTGDSCSSYGNRNFYNYFTDWFGSTGGGDVCAVPGDVGSAHRQYVTTTAVNARKAPSTACRDGAFTLAEGTILQARRVTADGDWIEVHTEEGPRWVSREYLRYATGGETECTVPSGTSSAHRQYVVRSGATVKLAPWAACSMGTSKLSAGTVLQATRVSATGKWLQVHTQQGLRWISRSAVDYATSADVDAVCKEPAGTSGASKKYVVTSAAPLWLSPLAKCGAGAQQLSTGAVLQATRVSHSGDWLEVRTQSGPRWIARSAVGYADSADVSAACVDPAGTKTASRQYVLRSTELVWASPLLRCGVDAKSVKAGTVVQATKVSASGEWLEIRTSSGSRWIQRDAVAVCQEPKGTGPAHKKYVVEETTNGLVSPLAECGTQAKYWGTGTGPRVLGVGTELQAVRVSSSGKWLQVNTSVGPRWVWRADLRQK